MKQIIPFKRELPFKTKVSEITSISLEREIKVEEEGIVTGVFHITGDYKMNEGSINREKFSFDLPFDITLDPRYDVKTVSADIEDFYYDIVNEDTLKVSIDLFVEADYLSESETKDEDRKVPEELKIFPEEMSKDLNDIEEMPVVEEPTVVKIETDLLEDVSVKEPRDNTLFHEDMPSLASDLFSNLDDTESYTTYYVYIVKEDDTIDKILLKYGISKDELEAYNDIASIKPGDKVIIPKTSE